MKRFRRRVSVKSPGFLDSCFGIEREVHFGAMDLIRTESVVKLQGAHFKLGPVDIALRSGEVLGIIGDRGSGKTTLLKLLWGFLRPDHGVISVFHLQPHLHQVSIRRHTGYLPESPCFDNAMTAGRHLQFISHFYDGWNQTEADALLEQFDIDPRSCIHELSNSERFKLSLVSAAAHNPFLLLLDNPMARLDTPARIEISEFLQTLASRRGIGIVVSAERSSDLGKLTSSTLKLPGGKTSD
jgi:ABC-type multidrug transport system ATPase subunit